MGIFFEEKFDETIFLKKASDLENRIDKLTELKNKGFNNEKLEIDLLLAKLGLQGEKEIEFELKNANIGMYVLHDINLEYQDLSAQIDYIVITAAKTYFIECKNLIGNIIVNEKGDFIREYIIKNKKIREGMYSPYRQAERHIDLYHKLWSLTNNGLFGFLKENRFEMDYIPLVVCANNKNILNTKYAPKNIKNRIIKSEQLINLIKKDLYNTERKNLLNKLSMENKAKMILSMHVEREKNYTELYCQNELSIKDDLKNKLIEYRKNKSKEMKVPAYYVFTNEELEKLVSYLPQTVDDLKKENIMPNVKIRIYGDDIIKIIKDYTIEII